MTDSRYNIELEIITPLCIGAGTDKNWLVGLDFILKEGENGKKSTIYVIDINKAVHYGYDKKLDLYIDSDRAFRNLPIEQLKKISKYTYYAPTNRITEIKAVLRSQLHDVPIVSGSSIKGAIRSALFKKLRSESENDDKAVFGDMDNGTDFMRFIQITDIKMPSTTDEQDSLSTTLVNTRLFNLYKKNDGNWHGGWKEKNTTTEEEEKDYHTTEELREEVFNNVYECIKPRMLGKGYLAMKRDAFKLLPQTIVSHQKEKKELLEKGNKHLFKVINQQTKTYLEKEKLFFEKYRTERNRAGEICQNIKTLIDIIEKSDGSYCLIKMSSGVGFHSVTGDWQQVSKDYIETGEWTEEEDRNLAGRRKYKSRRIAIYGGKLQLMGFVKLTDLSIAKEKQKKSDEYNNLIKEAEVLLIENKLKEAKIIVQKAATIMPNDEGHKIILKDIKEKAYHILIEEAKKLLPEDLAKAKKKAEEALKLFPERKEQEQIIKTTNKYSSSYSTVIEGVKYSDNIISETEKWLKYNHRSFGNAEFTVLEKVINSMHAEQRKKLERNKKFEGIVTIWKEKLFPKPVTGKPKVEEPKHSPLEEAPQTISYKDIEAPIQAEKMEQLPNEVSIEPSLLGASSKTTGNESFISKITNWFKNLFS